MRFNAWKKSVACTAFMCVAMLSYCKAPDALDVSKVEIPGPCEKMLRAFEQRRFLEALEGEWGGYPNRIWKIRQRGISISDITEEVDYPLSTVDWSGALPELLNVPDSAGILSKSVIVSSVRCKVRPLPDDIGGSYFGLVLFANVPDGFYQLRQNVVEPWPVVCYEFDFQSMSTKSCR